MYELTGDENVVKDIVSGAFIPRGHRWWSAYEAWVAEGNVPATPGRSLEELITETKSRISEWLDSVVQAKGYDDIVSCASYAASTNPAFQQEAEAAIAWRDAVYAKGYEILNAIPEGVTTPDHVMALMPLPGEFGWVE